MRKNYQLWGSIPACIGFLVMILDAKTAVLGAREGVMLCIYTVIPSLFPFFVLSVVMNSSLLGVKFPIMQPLCKFCKIPSGAESLLLLGILGGYPVGAKCINDAYLEKSISKHDARRMLGFCSNAGPAFIFGMTGMLFSTAAASWTLWLIQILSALIVGALLSKQSNQVSQLKTTNSVSVAKAIETSIKSIAGVCAWVLVFRVIIAFCDRWFLWLFPLEIRAIFVGFSELTNGVNMLSSITHEGVRFVLASLFLAGGGLCVAMQTVSVTKDVGIGMYFPGKALQGIISFLIASIAQRVIFPPSECWNVHISVYIVILLCGACILLSRMKYKKAVAISC